MNSVRFELDIGGLDELMQSGPMTSQISQAARMVAGAAGDGFESEVHLGDYTAIGTVTPATTEAFIENEEDNYLLKALYSVGLHENKGG